MFEKLEPENIWCFYFIDDFCFQRKWIWVFHMNYYSETETCDCKMTFKLTLLPPFLTGSGCLCLLITVNVN